MFCAKCGKEIPEDYLFCNHCGSPTKNASDNSDNMNFQNQNRDYFYSQNNFGNQNYNPYNNMNGNYNNNYNYNRPQPNINDAPSAGFALLCFFFPILGLILYIIWQNEYPLRAKSCGKGALICVIVNVGLFVFLMFIGILGVLLDSSAVRLIPVFQFLNNIIIKF